MTATESPDLSTPLLAIKGLEKSFGETRAVRGVDLTLRAGEFVGLMGPNGAGKSTLIKMLSGVYDADAGSIELSGRPVRNLAGRSEVGFVHQDLGLVDDMSVMDNLRLGAEPLRLLGPVLNRGLELKAAQEALDRVGLDVSVTDNVGTLSPGQKALLAVSRLLQLGARLIVVDETTSTLPPRESKWFVETLRAATTDGTCVLMVSHKLLRAHVGRATGRPAHRRLGRRRPPGLAGGPGRGRPSPGQPRGSRGRGGAGGARADPGR